MTTRGFEFAYMLDGSNATPLIRDFKLGEGTTHYAGDMMTMESDGFMDLADQPDDEMFGVIQESVGSNDITAGTTLAKVAIVTRNQVWRCSMDATSHSLVVGYTKNMSFVDQNTIDADGIALAAIQGLYQQNQEQQKEIAELKALVQQLLADKE